MKVKVGGPLAHRWSNGTIESWTGAEVDVDDKDTERVEFFRQLASVGNATILVDAPAPVLKAMTRLVDDGESDGTVHSEADAELHRPVRKPVKAAAE